MIAIAVVTGVLGVAQTWLSNSSASGHARPAHAGLPAPAAALARVLHAHAHRRGPVADRQRHRRRPERRHHDRDLDRLQRDDGARDASSRCSCSTGGWRCSRSACCRFFVLLTRRVGNAAREDHRRPARGDGRHLHARAGVALGLRHPARQDDGPRRELADRFEGESARLADLEVRSRMAGRWVMASIQTTFAIMPALVYWFAGPGARRRSTIGTLVAFTTLQTRLFFPIGQLLSVGDRHPDLARAVRPRVRVPRPPGRHRRAARATLAAASRGDVALRRRLVPLRRRAPGRSQDVIVDVPAGTDAAIVGETGSGKTTLGYLVARLYDAERGARDDRRRRLRDADASTRSPTRSASSRRRPTCSTRPSARTCASRGPTRPTRRSRRRPAPPRSTT